MSSENFLSGIFQPVVLNQLGQITVAAGYKAKFYAAGTDLPQTIYTDSALLVPYPSPSNIAFLDDTGKALIYLGLGGYKLVLTDPNNVPVPGYTIDNIVGIGTFGTGFVNSFEALRDVNTDVFPYTYIGGYFTPGDGGEGMFYNAVSGSAADGGYIQDSDFDPSKKWFRIPDESGKVRAASFGYISGSAGAINSSLQSADIYASGIFASLLIQGGAYTLTADVTLNSLQVEFESDVGFNAASLKTITFTGILSAPLQQFCGGGLNVSVVFSPQQIAVPEWFGANPGASDNTSAFNDLFASDAGGFQINPGTWSVTSAIILPTFAQRVLSFGKVTDGSTIYIPIGEYGLTVNSFLTVNGTVTVVGNIGATNINATSLLSGNTLSTTSDAFIGGVISSASGIVAGNETVGTLLAGGSVLAGNTGAGLLEARAGTGSLFFRAQGKALGGAINTRIEGTNSATLVLEANSITAVNDSIFIEAAGITSATTSSGYTFSITSTSGTFLTLTLGATANLDRWSLSCKGIWNGTTMTVSGVLNTNCTSGLTSTVFCNTEAFNPAAVQTFTLNATTPGPNVTALQYTIGIIPT